MSGPGVVGIELWDDHPLDGTGTWANIVGNYGQRGNRTTRTAALVNEGNVTSAPNIWYAADNIASGIPLYSGNNNSTGPVSGPDPHLAGDAAQHDGMASQRDEVAG